MYADQVNGAQNYKATDWAYVDCRNAAALQSDSTYFIFQYTWSYLE